MASAEVTKSKDGVNLRIEHTEFQEDDDMKMWATVTESSNLTDYNVSFFVEDNSVLEPEDQENNTYMFEESFSSGKWIVGTSVEGKNDRVNISETVTVKEDSEKEKDENKSEEEDSKQTGDNEDNQGSTDGEESKESEEMNVGIELGTEKVTPGDQLEIRADIEEDVNTDDLEFNWGERGLTRDPINEKNQKNLTVETVQRIRREEPELHLTVVKNERPVGEAEKTLTWHVPSVDAEGLEVDYESDSLTASVSAEKLDDNPEFRAGTSLKGLNQIELEGRNVAGGTELMMQQQDTSNYEDTDLIPYSVIDITGNNIEGLELRMSADLPENWLMDNDLLVSSKEAYVSFYTVEGDEWKRLPVRTGNSGIDNYYRIESESEFEESSYSLKGDTTIAIAGDPDGIDLGKFAVNPQGECERLEDDEPIPAGWEEIEVTCYTYKSIDRVERNLDRTAQDLNKTRYGEEIEEARNYLEEDRPGPARIKLEQLQGAEEVSQMKDQLKEIEDDLDRAEESGAEVDELREDILEIREDIEAFETGETGEQSLGEIDRSIESLQSETRDEIERSRSASREARERPPGAPVDEEQLNERRLNAELERSRNLENDTFDRLPEELKELENFYQPPEDLEERYSNIEQLIENGNLEQAQQELEQIEQEKMEAGLEKVQTGIETYDTIERLRDQEEIEQEQLETLNESERLLVEDQNVEQASNQVEEVRRDLQVQMIRDKVFEMLENQEFRQLVRDVIAEVTPVIS
ncbi:MAG: hypothetical protein BRC29_01475 [Nanohaloarchaea archaeon SW_7_43_1]|nr:MAG: hypothetical protein BRC29_01475 [Nanohaloarchaea archaeon SW_7_43_1]